ncbi:MOSC domain-containing protein [Thermomonospora cellulosilytica]|uniref:Uncharacterized protein YcbX n=1 Tax=Thermomonospora cellulosilytica TaxID=1411118 RepID=A0A7W3MX45_9ACTN|nr:MOSC N-terminal beta barrel domain-containing protein [Thermomonospora cellulosilytica]MBA9003515.1 uncharacterized protein YcbX [Thermomonospora cellulosilytica]
MTAVAELRRHPVKSMLGEDLAAAELTAAGVRGDRRWAVVDRETGRIASAKNPRLWRGLLKMTAAADGDAVAITLPDGKPVRSSDPDVDRRLSEVLGRPVELVREVPAGATLERAVPEQVLAAGVAARTAVEEVPLAGGTFVDLAPVHLITTSTLAAIGAASPRGAVEAARYRPNLVIRTAGSGFVENDWVGRELAVGSEAVLRVLVCTPRCAIPTLEHGGLPRDADALRVPAERNRVVPVPELGPRPCAGVYAEVVRPGRVERGDAVRLLG